MPFLKILLFALIAFCTSGCITDRQLLKTYRKSPSYSGFPGNINIAGGYHNRDTSGHFTLSSALFFWHGFNYRTLVKNDSIVALRLRYDGRKHLVVAAQDTAGKTTEVVLRVKNKGHYLSIKRKLYLIPVPFLFYVHHEQKTILTTNSDGDLIAIYGEGQTVWILFAGGHDEQTVSVFKRL